MTATKPAVRPAIPHFSSGPCAKRPGWTLEALTDAAFGRSHRAKIGKAKLKRRSTSPATCSPRPRDYLIGIVPASDTGAVEMALWSLLGDGPVICWRGRCFGLGWVTDVIRQPKREGRDARSRPPTASSPDLSKVDFAITTWSSPGTAPRPA